MMSSKMRLKIKTKYKMKKVVDNKNINKIVVNNFKEKIKPSLSENKIKEKPKINYLDRYKVYLGYILN